MEDILPRSKIPTKLLHNRFCESLSYNELDSHSLLPGLLADAEEQGSPRHSASKFLQNDRRDEVVREREMSAGPRRQLTK